MTKLREYDSICFLFIESLRPIYVSNVNVLNGFMVFRG